MKSFKKSIAFLLVLVITVAMCGVFLSSTASAQWSDVRVSNITASSVTLSWNRFPNAYQYQVFICENPYFTGARVDTVRSGSTTSYTVQGLKNNTMYYMRVDVQTTLSEHYFGRLISVAVCAPQPPQPANYPVYVLYYRDSTSGLYLGMKTYNLPLGAAINGNNISLTEFRPSGYTSPGTISGDTVVKNPYSTTYVVYTKPIVTTGTVCVNYYRGSVSSGNFLGSRSHTLAVGTAINHNTVNLQEIAPPSGYTYPSIIAPGSATVVQTGTNTVNVYYQQVPQTGTVCVNYYRGSVSSGNFLGSRSHTMNIGTAINHNTVNLQEIAPPSGYTYPSIIAPGSATVVQAGTNTVNVYYQQVQQTGTVCVSYYKDSVSNSNFLGSKTYTLTVGTAINGSSISLYEYAPSTGYITPGSITSGSPTTVQPGTNNVCVVYSKVQVQEHPVFVFYYKDVFSGTNIGSTILYLPEGTILNGSTVDLTLFVPNGYRTPGSIMAGSSTVVVPGINAVFVIYSPLIIDL